MGTRTSPVVRRRRRTIAVALPSLAAYVLGASLTLSGHDTDTLLLAAKVQTEERTTRGPPTARQQAASAGPAIPTEASLLLTAAPDVPPSTTPTTVVPTTEAPAAASPPPPTSPPARTRDQRCHDAIAAVGRSPAPGFGLACGNGYNSGTDGHTTYFCSDGSNGSTCTGTAYIHPDDGDSDAMWRAVVHHELNHTECIRYHADFSEACAG
jgi:hypothetical protein